MSERIESFRDPNVYKLAIELQQEIFILTRKFPKEELYSLTDQIRRASRSIGANIAESWQKRRYPAHFVSKLSDADGEQAETQHWMDTSLRCKYFSVEEHSLLAGKMQEDWKNAWQNDGRTEKMVCEIQEQIIVRRPSSAICCRSSAIRRQSSVIWILRQSICSRK